MKPLRNEPYLSDDDARAAQVLLSRVLPLEPSADRQRRVRLRLDESGRSPLRSLLRPAVLGVVALAVTAAGARVGGLWPRESARSPAALPPSAALDAPRAALENPQHASGRASSADLPLEATAAPPTKAEHAASRHKTAEAAASSAAARLMIEAMQARRAGDTERARELLDEYRRKHPKGALQEEALALSMEAAAARRDKSSLDLARQYLTRYPNGRFREQAERVLHSKLR